MEPVTDSPHGRPGARHLVTAYVRQAPPEPPGALRRWLNPVLDDSGRPLDWELDVPAMVAVLEPGRIGPAVAAHRRWQRTRGHVVAIDEAAEVRQLAADAHRVHLDLLAGVGDLPHDVPVDDLVELDLQCQEAEAMFTSIDRTAWEFTDADTSTPVRRSAPTGPVRIAYGVDPVDWEIELSSRGLRLRLTDRVHTLAGWTLSARGLWVHTDDGDLDVAGAPARALVHLAPATVSIEVRRVDLATAHSGRLARLRAACRAGVNQASGVVLLTGTGPRGT